MSSSATTDKKSGKSPKSEGYKKARKIFLKTILFSILAGLVVTSIVVIAAINSLPPLSELENPQLNLSTQIFSADGQKLGNFYEVENREYLPIGEMDKDLLSALIATEDARFYNHSGFDPKNIASLIYRNLIKGQSSGGSTLTMQLARNLYDQVGKDRTPWRKVKEIIVSFIIERKFTKVEIMQAYLNTTSIYGNTYGIELGAKSLFSKSARDLELHEAALLIGLLKGPSYYNPKKHPDRALLRRNTVINQMVKYDFIEKNVAERFKSKELELNPSKGSTSTALGSYYLIQIKKELGNWIKKDGSGYDLYADGLRVYTSIDSRMQNYAEEAVKEHLKEHQKLFDDNILKRRTKPWEADPNILKDAIKQTERYKKMKDAGMSDGKIDAAFDEKRKMKIWTWEGLVDTTMTPKDSVLHYLRFLETGFMAMDPHSGHIKAWVGGINYNYFQYDHVNQGKRQVGSTFKPFVYGAALEEGVISPCDPVLDMDVIIDLDNGKRWNPKNSGDDEGLLDYKTGLAKSKNKVTAAVYKKLSEHGNASKKICKFAKRMGIESKLDCVPAMILGTNDLSVEEMVTSYCTFANGGYRQKPILITRIEDKAGNVIADFNTQAEQVLDEETAYTISAMLMGVVDHPSGTAHYGLRGRYGFKNQIGGKTGTTQNQSDGWFMGITPNLVAGAWVGCANRKMRFNTIRYGQGARMALPIWAIFMKKVYSDQGINMPDDPFVKPKTYSVTLNCPVPSEKDTVGEPDDLPWGM